MAFDYQSLVTRGQIYTGGNDLTQFQVLKLALLQYIASTLAPTVATDYQSLLNDVNVPGWRCTSNAGVAGILELALLQIIANNIGSGTGGSANYYKNYGGASPTDTPASGNPFAYDTSTAKLWLWSGSAWTGIIG